MEQYVKKPAAVQVFALNGATDIIPVSYTHLTLPTIA